jgi:hypothetical protein
MHNKVDKFIKQKTVYYMKKESNNANTLLAAAVKSDWDLRKCFEQLRFDKNHHLGLGDIRLTIGQQEEICELVERFYRCR